LKELATEVEKNEEGCLSYAVFASPVDNTVVVFERCVATPGEAHGWELQS
jgi:hypothetical protein